MVDALLALVFWSVSGLTLMAQTQRLMIQQRSAWMLTQAAEWQADAFERLRLARVGSPQLLSWGQAMSANACVDSVCNASDWRDSLLADWQTRLSREAPQVQTGLFPWAVDTRLQVVALRWPEPGAPSLSLPLNNEVCPPDWRCVVMLGWP
jgi:hypothetical protein